MEKEIQKTVKQVTRDKYDLDKDLEEPVELDEMELEKHIEFVVREVRKKGVNIKHKSCFIFNRSNTCSFATCINSPILF